VRAAAQIARTGRGLRPVNPFGLVVVAALSILTLSGAATISAGAAMTSSASFSAYFSCPGGLPTASGTIQGYSPGSNSVAVALNPNSRTSPEPGVVVKFSASSATFTFSVSSLPPGQYPMVAVDIDAGTYLPATNLLAGTASIWSFTIGSCNSAVTAPPPPSFVVMVATPDGNGYWLAKSNGTVEAFGDALWYGDASGLNLNKGIVSMAATPDGGGYWLLGGDGGVFAYGDATFYGSTGNIVLNKPALGMAVTPDGKGYWFVASDGGVFAYGDARFYGSMGGTSLNQPVVGMAVDQATGGYWLVAADGGAFSFNAPFWGSTGNIALNEPIVGMEAATDGSGYRFVASDGGVFCFNLPFEGAITQAGAPNVAPPTIVAIAAHGTLGYWLLSTQGVVYSAGNAPFFGNGS